MKNINESGRSMVEMIGVLAIMGLLTVAGVAGFRVAMHKHYCNQTIERLMSRAVVISTQRQMGQETISLSFDPNDGKYPIPNNVVITVPNLFV